MKRHFPLAARLLRSGDVAPRNIPTFALMARLRGECAASAETDRTLRIEVGKLTDESMPRSMQIGFSPMSAVGGKRTSVADDHLWHFH